MDGDEAGSAAREGVRVEVARTGMLRGRARPLKPAAHGIADGDTVRVTSRRGSMTLPAKVVATIRPDTVFIPYHWAGRQAANQLTNRALDPLSKIPEYKVCAVRLERAG